MKGAEKIRWITPTKSPTNPEQLPRRHLPTFPQGAMSSPTVPDRPTDRPGCEDTADRARAQIKLDQEDHGQSVTSPATPRIPVVAGRAGWVLDRVPVRPPSINRSFSRRLFLGVSCPVLSPSHTFDPERDARRSLVGARLRETWVDIEDVCPPEVAIDAAVQLVGDDDETPGGRVAAAG